MPLRALFSKVKTALAGQHGEMSDTDDEDNNFTGFPHYASSDPSFTLSGHHVQDERLTESGLSLPISHDDHAKDTEQQCTAREAPMFEHSDLNYDDTSDDLNQQADGHDPALSKYDDVAVDSPSPASHSAYTHDQEIFLDEDSLAMVPASPFDAQDEDDVKAYEHANDILSDDDDMVSEPSFAVRQQAVDQDNEFEATEEDLAQHLETENKDDRDIYLADAAAMHEGHAADCTCSPGASTPDSDRACLPNTPVADATPERISAQISSTPPALVSPDSSLSGETRAVKEHTQLHGKAITLKPRTRLASQRYWVGVLHPHIKVKDVRKERDFIWMKAHRGNTVRTIKFTYLGQTALPEDFDLIIQGETPRYTDVMEELDYHNDKHVIFRAIPKKDIIELD